MLEQTQRLKRTKSCQFVSKLIDMMEKYPSHINWTQKGDELIVSKPNQVQNLILPSYFRHNKFASFIRQLNMYGFCKKEKSDFFLRFSHKIFRKGNQSQFSTIKRKSKGRMSSKQMETKLQNSLKVIQCINHHINLTDKEKQIFVSLFQYKNSIEDALISIKQDIDELEQQVQQDYNEVQQLVKQVKEQFYDKLQNTIDAANQLNQFAEFELKFEEMQLKHTDGDKSIEDQCSFDQGLHEDNQNQNFGYTQPKEIQIDQRFRFQCNQLSQYY